MEFNNRLQTQFNTNSVTIIKMTLMEISKCVLKICNGYELILVQFIKSLIEHVLCKDNISNGIKKIAKMLHSKVH